MARHLYSRGMRGFCTLTAALAAILAFLAFGAQSIPADPPTPLVEPASLQTPAAHGIEITAPSVRQHTETAPLVVSGSPLPPLTGQCNDPTAGGGVRLSAIERKRNRKVVDLVAREMGVDRATRRMLVRWAVREGDSNPATVHTLRPDRNAATRPRSRAKVEALGQLWGPEWSYGRGLYGMQPALFVGRWDPTAHPDVLCDPVVATIVAVWSARFQQRDCSRKGYPKTLLVSNRRFGSGHCWSRSKDAVTVAWWAARGRDVETTRANWGRRWREDTTDRAEIYAHMREEIHTAKLDAASAVK